MTPARLLYAAAPKCPKPTEPATERCYLCGLPCDGLGVRAPYHHHSRQALCVEPNYEEFQPCEP